jgi:hypothetical protein
MLKARLESKGRADEATRAKTIYAGRVTSAEAQTASEN